MRRYDEAIQAYETGLKIEDSPALRKGLKEVVDAKRKYRPPTAFSPPLGQRSHPPQRQTSAATAPKRSASGSSSATPSSSPSSPRTRARRSTSRTPRLRRSCARSSRTRSSPRTRSRRTRA
ncbi:hypothetical protein BV20DRAFT_91354 [Pilatotrama ljubarskyi]|nr:hypothetical protein BV20DRAFT_91354 [Pilatotrama ljubarskyi]